jgi:hypothetical protein
MIEMGSNGETTTRVNVIVNPQVVIQVSAHNAMLLAEMLEDAGESRLEGPAKSLAVSLSKQLVDAYDTTVEMARYRSVLQTKEVMK